MKHLTKRQMLKKPPASRYYVEGKRNGKPYKSRMFKTEEEARRYGYSLVYTKDGNKKRTGKNVLYDWHTVGTLRKR